ncbi:MFS transporter [Streptomyces sp. SID12501]|uniref:MFS transporter n=1 Tax=Streptomyces sp. SID12501 TaxID=2706042 RepID=A0A6B3BPY4_9ACTN|nr:MFS transporter [Streptomyces sp. SID12501]NEC86409.1 MFS transporter [Streptomyces sp. SID12501]
MTASVAETGRSAPSVTGRRRSAGLAVVCTGMLLLGLDNSILNVALPSLQQDPHLGIDTAGLQWVTDAYPLALAGLVLACGRWGDRYGRRRAFMLGMAVCGVASVFGAAGVTPTQLTAARAGMGLGGALIMPATLSLTVDLFRGHPRSRTALATWTASASIGLVLGPALGGWLLEHFSWRSGFWINVPVCAVALLFARPLLPDSKDRGGRPLDPAGTVLGILALTTAVYGIITAPHRGWASTGTVSVLLLGALLFALYARRERRLPVPSLPLDLLRGRHYAGAVVVLVLLFFTLAGMGFVVVLYLQGVLGYTPLQAGLRMLPCAAAAIVGSGCALLLPGRFGPRVPVVSGGGLAFLGYVVLTTTDAGSGYGRALTALTLVGLGLGLASLPCTEIVMNAAHPNHAGTAAAMNDTTRAVGSSLGIAVLGSVVNSVYTGRMTERGPHFPPGTPGTTSEQTIGALPAVSTLPPEQAAPLIAAARDAFVHAMTVAAVPAAGVAATAGLTAWFLLRSADPMVAAANQREPLADSDRIRAVHSAKEPAV